MPAGTVADRPRWIVPAGAGLLALLLAGLGWVALAVAPPQTHAVGPAAAMVFGGGCVLAAFGVPWIAAAVPAERWPVRGLQAAGWWLGASVAGAVAGLLPAGGPPVGGLLAWVLLLTAFGAWLAALVAAGRAWGLRPATGQLVAWSVALLQCTTPIYAEPVVRAVPGGVCRAFTIDWLTNANPLLVTGRSILDWDIWHNPYLYGFTDVAGYGPDEAHWAAAAAAYALGAGLAGTLAWWRAPHRDRGSTGPTAGDAPTPRA